MPWLWRLTTKMALTFFWRDAVMDMELIMQLEASGSFENFNVGESPYGGLKYTTYVSLHIPFDVKFDLRRNYGWREQD